MLSCWHSYRSTYLHSVLAISQVYKGQNQELLWAGQKNMGVVGFGADGDSKVHKYYTDQFKRRHGQKNSVIDIDYESFGYNFVFEDLRDIGVTNPVPTIMFPDRRHLIKKWRNKLLNVKRLLVIGDGIAQLEHLMKTFESD